MFIVILRLYVTCFNFDKCKGKRGDEVGKKSKTSHS